MTDYETDLKYIRRDLDAIMKKLDEGYVTKAEFAPVKTIVYGLVGLMLTAVVAALLGLVITKGL